MAGSEISGWQSLATARGNVFTVELVPHGGGNDMPFDPNVFRREFTVGFREDNLSLVAGPEYKRGGVGIGDVVFAVIPVPVLEDNPSTVRFSVFLKRAGILGSQMGGLFKAGPDAFWEVHRVWKEISTSSADEAAAALMSGDGGIISDIGGAVGGAVEGVAGTVGRAIGNVTSGVVEPVTTPLVLVVVGLVAFAAVKFISD